MTPEQHDRAFALRLRAVWCLIVLVIVVSLLRDLIK